MNGWSPGQCNFKGKTRWYTAAVIVTEGKTLERFMDRCAIAELITVSCKLLRQSTSRLRHISISRQTASLQWEESEDLRARRSSVSAQFQTSAPDVFGCHEAQEELVWADGRPTVWKCAFYAIPIDVMFKPRPILACTSLKPDRITLCQCSTVHRLFSTVDVHCLLCSENIGKDRAHQGWLKHNLRVSQLLSKASGAVTLILRMKVYPDWTVRKVRIRRGESPNAASKAHTGIREFLIGRGSLTPQNFSMMLPDFFLSWESPSQIIIHMTKHHLWSGRRCQNSRQRGALPQLSALLPFIAFL